MLEEAPGRLPRCLLRPARAAQASDPCLLQMARGVALSGSVTFVSA